MEKLSQFKLPSIVIEQCRHKSGVDKYPINLNLEGLGENEKSAKLKKLIKIEDAILEGDNDFLRNELKSEEGKEFTSAIYPNGSNLIFFAAKRHKADVVKTLIDCGCDCNLRDSKKLTILENLARKGTYYRKTIKELIDVEPGLVYLKDEEGYMLIHRIVMRGEDRRVLDFLKYDKNLANAQDGSKNTPLYWAVYSQNLKMAEIILKHNPESAKILNNICQNSMHCAVSSGDIEMVQLIEKYAPGIERVRERQYFDQNSLHIAAEKGCLPIIKFLINCDEGLIVEKDKYERLPIDLAKENGHTDVVEFLEEYQKTHPEVLQIGESQHDDSTT